MRKRFLKAFPSHNVLREADSSSEKVLENQEDVMINEVLTVWQKKRQEEKLRFEAHCTVSN